MKRNPLNFMLAVLILFNSCDSSDNNSKKEVRASSTSVEESAPVLMAGYAEHDNRSSNNEVNKLQRSENNVVNKQKIIKDGNLAIKSLNFYKSKADIDLLVKSLGAYYETENLYNGSDKISYFLKVRIPSNNFEKFILKIESGGDEITNKSINARDVTEEYYDLETRLSSKHAYLKRYQAILIKANTINEILAIEEKIRVIEEEIESTEGRLRFLNDQVGYSTLDIHLFKEKEQAEIANEDGFFDRVSKSLGSGWEAIVDFIVWILSIWPFLIILSVGYLFAKRYLRKKALK